MTTARRIEPRRRARMSSPALPERPLVRGRSGDLRIEFDARPVYDFVTSLGSIDGLDYDLLPEDRRWLEGAREGLSVERQRDLQACFGHDSGGICQGISSLPVLHPEIRTARDLVQLIATMDTRQLVREMCSEVVLEPGVAPLLERAMDGDEAAYDALPDLLPESECTPVLELLRAPTVWIDRLRGLLADWLARFETIEQRVAGMEARDVELRQADREALSPADLIERTTGGLRWLPDPRISRVILAPSYFGRPYNHITFGAGWRLFAYPLAEAALDGADEMAPPEAVLRLYRALGDDSRLRILRLLADRELYLTELAQQLELSKPTVKHHLAQLRAAGLVTVIEEGNLTYYRLRRDRVAEAGAELNRFLH